MLVTQFIIRRLVFSIFLLFGVSVIVFALVNAVGNPIEILLAERPGISQQAIDQMTAYYGLDQPATTRYLIWAGNLLQGDFGTSIIYNQPVWQMMTSWGLETLKIQVPGILIALALATAMAVTAALRTAASVMMRSGVSSSCTISTMRRPQAEDMRWCPASAAGIDEAPGRVSPIASVIAVMVEAVPMVMQVPTERAMPP